MKRMLLSVALVSAGFLALAGDLWAHGGQFRGPGGSVPPSMREPTDPTPPPPPPPSGGPPTTPPPTTPGAGPTAPTPTTPQPTTPPPVSTDLPGAGGTGKKSPLSFESWLFWYENNKEDIERLKDAIYSRMTSDNPLGQLGGQRDAAGQASGATQATATKVDSTIIPALIWAMDPDNASHQDIESAAYIALAKLTRDPVHIEKITQGLSLEAGKKRDQITIESAALALGLLRRAETSRQFAASELDKVRTTLFDVIENEKHATGTRSFAAMALGLLGDQPTGSGEYAGDIDAARKATTARLWDLIQRKWSDENIPVALLMGLGLQPKSSVTEDMQSKLADATLKGKLGTQDVSDIVRSYAALQLRSRGRPRRHRSAQDGPDRPHGRQADAALGRHRPRPAGPPGAGGEPPRARQGAQGRHREEQRCQREELRPDQPGLPRQQGHRRGPHGRDRAGQGGRLPDRPGQGRQLHAASLRRARPGSRGPQDRRHEPDRSSTRTSSRPRS